MNGKASKLISRFCHWTGRNYNEMKRWYEGLSGPQRAEATKMMRDEVAKHEPVEQDA